MHQEKGGRGCHCHFCGRDNVTLAVIGRRVKDKRRICADCAAAALRLLSNRSAGARANKLHLVDA
jgi:hypothetical protein